jgi:superfamily I DNA/RNA helicase
VSKQRRQDALGNIEGLKQAATRFDTARDYFKSLNDAEQKQRQLKKAASLVIASIASVKGLKFDQVVLPFLAQGRVSSAHSFCQGRAKHVLCGNDAPQTVPHDACERKKSQQLRPKDGIQALRRDCIRVAGSSP